MLNGPVLQDPTTPTPQPLTGITQHRFSHHPLSFATTHGFVGGEIQLWKIQLFAFKRGVVTPWLQFDRASDHRGIS
jgi:hypothetical protein